MLLITTTPRDASHITRSAAKAELEQALTKGGIFN